MELDEIRQRLDLWSGGRAEVWDYTASHATLRVKLSLPTGEAPAGLDPKKACAALTFHGCRSVKFESVWGSVSLHLEACASERDALLKVVDPGRLEVHCEGAHVTLPLPDFTAIPRFPLDRTT